MKLLRIVVALGVLGLGSPAGAAPTEITLFHVNDTHSHLLPWGPKSESLEGTLGGLGRVAAVVGSEPDALFVHAGDLFHGDLFFNDFLGVAELQLLASLGLDVLAVGNHELQYTPELLLGVLAQAFPPGAVSVVSSNLENLELTPLGLWITSTAMKEANGVRVGFFGLITPRDLLAQPFPLAIDHDLAAAASAAVAELRAAGAQVVVCLAHLGLDDSRAVAGAVPGIDVVVNGHDHVALFEPLQVGATIVVSAGEYYRWVGRLRLSVDGSSVSLVDYALVGIDAAIPPVPEVQAILAELRSMVVARHGDVYGEVIGWAAQDVTDQWDPRKAKRDTALGDLFTDAYRAWTGTDIAVEAAGFLDQGIPEGPIVVADLYHSMDYGVPDPEAGYTVRPFELVTFGMTGEQLLGALELALAEGGDLFPQVSGMRLGYDSTRDPYARILSETVHVLGRGRLDAGAVYTVTGNEGLVYFLQAFGFDLSDVRLAGASVIDAARALIEQRGVVDASTSGRLRDVAADAL